MKSFSRKDGGTYKENPCITVPAARTEGLTRKILVLPSPPQGRRDLQGKSLYYRPRGCGRCFIGIPFNRSDGENDVSSIPFNRSDGENDVSSIPFNRSDGENDVSSIPFNRSDGKDDVSSIPFNQSVGKDDCIINPHI